MGNHRVLFEFKDSRDVDCVLKGETWSFNKHLVALKQVSTSFWVQVHNLPIGNFSMAVAKEVALVAGVIDGEETAMGDGEGCNFLKVQIAINPTNPLCRGRKIMRRDRLASRVNFKYKRLPNICYWCGRLTHHEKDYPSRPKKRGAALEDEK